LLSGAAALKALGERGSAFQLERHPQPLQAIEAMHDKEIGITALAAALHVMAKPTAPKSVATLDERRIPIPAILRGDDLAA
jgi:hypothetical protein